MLLALAGVAGAQTFTISTVNQKGGVTAAVVDGQMERHMTFYYEPQPIRYASMETAFPDGTLEFASYGRMVIYWRGGLLEVVGVW